MEASSNNQLYTTLEAMSILRIGYLSLLRRIKHSEIKAIKLGKQWRIPESEITAFLKRQVNETKNETK